MPTTKKGQREVRVVIDEGSEVETTLLEWARKRGLTPGTATRCILVDWAEAISGKPNPFALAIPITTGIPPQSPDNTLPQEPEMSAEEKARLDAKLQAAEQFM